MECVSKINLFGLQMMVKSGLDIIILKFFHAQNYFCYFIKMTKIASSLIKITFFAHGGISMKLFVMYLNIINKTLKQRIPPIFHFECVNKVWISIKALDTKKCGLFGQLQLYSVCIFFFTFGSKINEFEQKKSEKNKKISKT